jgi:hypothetical protein
VPVLAVVALQAPLRDQSGGAVVDSNIRIDGIERIAADSSSTTPFTETASTEGVREEEKRKRGKRVREGEREREWVSEREREKKVRKEERAGEREKRGLRENEVGEVAGWRGGATPVKEELIFLEILQQVYTVCFRWWGVIKAKRERWFKPSVLSTTTSRPPEVVRRLRNGFMISLIEWRMVDRTMRGR